MSEPVLCTLPLPQLFPRELDSHKGSFGRLLIVGGSQGMAGAPALSGRAALRSGAGLVKLATPGNCLSTVASFEPCAMTLALPTDEYGQLANWALPVLEQAASEATVVAVGPGLGRSDSVTQIVHWLYQSVASPMIVDADGLNALAERPEILRHAPAPRILTPHPGEFCRLTGRDHVAAEDRVRLASDFADETGTVLVLKGYQSVIAERRQYALNATGNPGMATAGSGDVLTGIISALVGQHLDPFDAARLGAHLHGLAGDLAAADLGQESLIASDLIAFLPRAFRRYSQG